MISFFRELQNSLTKFIKKKVIPKEMLKHGRMNILGQQVSRRLPAKEKEFVESLKRILWDHLAILN